VFLLKKHEKGAGALNDTTLAEFLTPHWRIHRQRLVFLAQLVVSLVLVRTVSWSRLANAVDSPKAGAAAYRRIQRLFGWVGLSQESYCGMVLGLVGNRRLTLVMDRTDWKLGQRPLNILMLGFVWQGIAIPLVWTVLGKSGSSNMAERIELMQRLFGIQPQLQFQVEAFLADREFIGDDWLGYLREQGLRRCIRIRKNFRTGLETKGASADTFFRHLAVGQQQTLKRRKRINGELMYLVGLRLENDYLIVATDLRPEQGLSTYGLRWGIETLFGCLKSRGFNLEQTHVTQSDKLSRLLILLATAVLWAFSAGLWLHKKQPIPLKKHGRRAISFFRLGLDYLERLIRERSFPLPVNLLRLLSCT